MHNINHRRVIALVALMGLLITLATGCQNREQTGKIQEQPLQIGVIPVEDNLPFFVAEDQGMFTEAGLDVKLVSFNSARERDTAMQAGQLDGVVADLVAEGLLKKAGSEVRVVSLTMGVTPAEGRFVLLAAPQSKIQQPADLKGVPVAISENTIIEYITDRLLLGAGLAKEDIKKTPVPSIPDRLQLLLNGTVEAAVLPDPMASLAASKGARVILDDTQGTENISQVVLLFSTDGISKKKEAIEKLIDVYAQAASEVTGDPDKFRELFITKARVPEDLSSTYLTPTFSPPTLPNQEDLDKVMSWMVDKKLLEKPYSYAEMVDNEFISERNQ